ncbi:FeoB-associated Cys-rich membrane protein [Chrysiogenes arsenatis]|uniref:FeoB-associated Cys-rich membrane protein n=1 Tax=Chrysiogenes arsenatis TaxID=309797 RepID=UPI00040C56D5|nr:FeoB-associated Cys-rich membrane protein [Chrysiogenes arsenatis]
MKTLDILIVLGAIAVAVVYLVQRARAKKEEPPKNCGSSCSGKDNCSSGGCH